ncbi:MAG: helix-turn-helix domain-containing protein [archaeon]
MEFEKLRETLLELGLSPAEIQVYNILLNYHDGTVGFISRQTDMQRNRVYSILQSLEKKGFVKLIDTKPKKYALEDADIAINKFEQYFREKAEKKIEKIRKYKDTLKSLIHRELTFEDYVKRAENEVIISLDEETLKKKVELLIPCLKAAFERGANIKIISDADPSLLKEFQFFTKYIKESPKNKFILIDNSLLLMHSANGFEKVLDRSVIENIRNG